MSAKTYANVALRLGVRRFDAAEYLRDEADIAAYLEADAAEEDPRVLAICSDERSPGEEAEL